MQPLTIYIADADYNKVIQALSVAGLPDLTEATNATESKALDALTRMVMAEVERFDREAYFQGFVFVPPDVVNPEPWVQPTGAHDAYAADAVVLYNDQVWRNVHGDGNVWVPGEFGWALA